MGVAGRLTVFVFRFKAPVVHTFRRGGHAPPCGRRSPHRGRAQCGGKGVYSLSEGLLAGPALPRGISAQTCRPGPTAAPRRSRAPPRRAIGGS